MKQMWSLGDADADQWLVIGNNGISDRSNYRLDYLWSALSLVIYSILEGIATLINVRFLVNISPWNYVKFDLFFFIQG